MHDYAVETSAHQNARRAGWAGRVPSDVSDDATHPRLNQARMPDYGPGAGKGGEVLVIGVPEAKLTVPVFGTQTRKLSRALTTLVETLDASGSRVVSPETL
ncbi:hypothetical protein [Streptomyces xiaopingdaonensis]|uniref:hypothetical protein n=1 Tax=Streptomyces xiaopingdaonensis TaxID=1565415 RepID=UPI0012FEBAB0|nr:hypothetical protein [Streptomyces xiaopingdaonensis]